jgi:hypothetical protein
MRIDIELHFKKTDCQSENQQYYVKGAYTVENVALQLIDLVKERPDVVVIAFTHGEVGLYVSEHSTVASVLSQYEKARSGGMRSAQREYVHRV